MRNWVYAAATVAASVVFVGALSLTTPSSGAWARESAPLVNSLLSQDVVDAAALEGQTPAHPLPDLDSGPVPERRGILRGNSLSDLVDYHGGGQTPNREAECLAITVYHESRGEPLAGQLAVAQTVLNRTRSGRFPASICAVVTQKSQFSFVRGGVLPGAPRSSEQWRRAVGIAHIAQNGLAESGVGSALFFHARSVAPGWKLRRLGAVGNHIFYR